MHFEDLWNKSEEIGNNAGENDTTHNIAALRHAVDKLEESDTIEESHKHVGEILFELCQITRQLNVNSAAALYWTLETRKARLLDPESEEDEKI